MVVGMASAQTLCTDSDGGGSKASDTSALETKADVKYGITTQIDTCLSSENGVSTSTSIWLKEYFCDNDKRESKSYDCVDLGYTRCQNGACFSNGTVTKNITVPQTPKETCGDKITDKDKGEECDPPNSICFGRTTAQYGSCQADCTCKISASAEAAEQVCGDGYIDAPEECEEDDDCDSDYLCSSCKCVKELTAEEIEEMTRKAVEEKEEEKEEIKEKIDEKYDTSEPVDIEIEPKNFSDELGQ